MKKEERKKLVDQIMDQCLVDHKKDFCLSHYKTHWDASDEIKELSEKKLKKKAKKVLEQNLEELSTAQEFSDKRTIIWKQ